MTWIERNGWIFSRCWFQDQIEQNFSSNFKWNKTIHSRQSNIVPWQMVLGRLTTYFPFGAIPPLSSEVPTFQQFNREKKETETPISLPWKKWEFITKNLWNEPWNLKNHEKWKETLMKVTNKNVWKATLSIHWYQLALESLPSLLILFPRRSQLCQRLCHGRSLKLRLPRKESHLCSTAFRRFFFSRIREIRLVTWWSTNMLRGRYLVVILSYEIWRVTDGHGVTCQNITKWQHPTIYQVYISGRASPPALFKTRGAKRFWTNLAGVHGSLGFFIPKFSETNSARKYIKH